MPLGLALAGAASALASPHLLMAAGATLSAAMFAAALPSRWLRAVD